MILMLRILFSLVLITMLCVTSWASLNEDILKIPVIVQKDPWFIATLFDAYFGFLTFYAWLFYRENKWLPKAIWFVLIMLLGNMAMATYLLFVLFRLPLSATAKDVLLSPERAG
ncbi:MAG: DUF1475 domain-containing protein [Cyanobacteria bacterium]|nr:DUF1475 domain-containing protein [Cyanobacteriota bacterium]